MVDILYQKLFLAEIWSLPSWSHNLGWNTGQDVQHRVILTLKTLLSHTPKIILICEKEHLVSAHLLGVMSIISLLVTECHTWNWVEEVCARNSERSSGWWYLALPQGVCDVQLVYQDLLRIPMDRQYRQWTVLPRLEAHMPLKVMCRP